MCAAEFEQALMFMRSAPKSPHFEISSVLENAGLPHGSETRKCVHKQLSKFFRDIYLSRFTLDGLLEINRLGVPDTTMYTREFGEHYSDLGLGNDPFGAHRCQVHRWYLNLVQPNFGKTVAELELVKVRLFSRAKELFAVSKAFVDKVIESELMYLRSNNSDSQPEKRSRITEDEADDDPYTGEDIKFLMEEDWSFDSTTDVLHNPHTVHIPDVVQPSTLSEKPPLASSKKETELVLKHVERCILNRITMAGDPIQPLLKHLMDRLFIPATEFQKIMIKPSGNSETVLNPHHLSWFTEHVAPLAGSDINMSDHFQMMIVLIGGTKQNMITLSAARIGPWMDALRTTILS